MDKDATVKELFEKDIENLVNDINQVILLHNDFVDKYDKLQQRIDKTNNKMEELLYLASKCSTIYKDDVEVVGIYDRLEELSSILKGDD